MHGVLVLDKPPNLSSAAAVDHVKRALGAARAGHGGTLDPIATGVLAVCIDAATKLAPYLLADDKAYEAEGLFGVETDTLDRGGRVLRESAVDVTEAALRDAIAKRIGEQEQIPPMFSALKQGGRRLYHLARAGEEVERAPRKIRIDVLELLLFEPPRFRVRIACSKGTYVRTILADLGTDVGCGAHMTELRRTVSGRFSLAQAVTLERVLEGKLIPLAEVTGLPVIQVPETMRKHALSGVQFSVETWGELPEKAERFQLLDERGQLIAIIHFEDGKTIYDRVFPEVAGT
ncbi:MAG: tRNA pseudouridine(55) synthase TruB [Myxococcota bacterium]|nr:tRNA pseudouridine(55) synthase TruB [Myxococcota bacterium]